MLVVAAEATATVERDDDKLVPVVPSVCPSVCQSVSAIVPVPS